MAADPERVVAALIEEAAAHVRSRSEAIELELADQRGGAADEGAVDVLTAILERLASERPVPPSHVRWLLVDRVRDRQRLDELEEALAVRVAGAPIAGPARPVDASAAGRVGYKG